MVFKKGHIPTVEHRNKLSLALIGNKRTLGKKLTDDHKKKISEGGIKRYENSKHSMLGKSLTEEHKKKISKGVLKSFTPEVRKKIGDLHRGSRSSTWKGGITSMNELIRKSSEYKLLRKICFERDKYACIWGGKEHGNQLEMDHIKPFSTYPELRLALDNVRTLCKLCHKKTDTYGRKINKK